MTIATGSLTGVGGGIGVSWVATGRMGGYSQAPFDGFNLAGYLGDDQECVSRNIERAASLIGVEQGQLAIMQGVHGAKVARVIAGGIVHGVDALVTTVPGLGLMALAADCVPVVMADSDTGVIAAVHCGWRGLVAGVMSASVEVMREAGAEHIRAIIGPSICAGCYPVPPERIAELRAEVSPAVATAACSGSTGNTIDVSAGVRQQLVEESVDYEQIHLCTAESAELFSYRRDGLTGRQGLMVCR